MTIAMTSVLIRNLDEQTVRRLKQRAARNGRSLQAELASILEDAARDDTTDWNARLDRVRERLGLKGRVFSDSADLIREDRDR